MLELHHSTACKAEEFTATIQRGLRHKAIEVTQVDLWCSSKSRRAPSVRVGADTAVGLDGLC